MSEQKLKDLLAQIVVAAQAVCEADLGAEPWDELCDGIDAALEELEPEDIEKAQEAAASRRA